MCRLMFCILPLPPFWCRTFTFLKTLNPGIDYEIENPHDAPHFAANLQINNEGTLRIEVPWEP